MFELAIIVTVIIGLGQVLNNLFQANLCSCNVSVDGTIQEQIFIGVVIGLASCGLFDVAKLPFIK